MEINRSNYETWFIDSADGNLDENKVEQLEIFLSENPDLKDEFNDLILFRLTPSGISYGFKERLKKLPSGISRYQFDYLCTAYFEKDLTADQRAELEESAGNDPEKKKSFELIGKSRLIPEKIIFKHKSILLRSTLLRTALQRSVIAFASAAAIILLISIYLNSERNASSGINSKSNDVITEGVMQKSLQEALPGKIKSEEYYRDAITEIKEPFHATDKETGIKQGKDMTPSVLNDSAVNNIRNKDLKVYRAPVSASINFKEKMIPDALVACKSSFSLQKAEDGRSKIGRSVSKLFREKLLKEKSPPDTPLKGYEIAEAGVNGLNKLFGWQMALGIRNDDSNQLKSVYFRSKLLKFDAPVKKSESVP